MKRNWKKPALLLGAFCLWTVLVCTLDVQAVGPEGSRVGMAAMNVWFHRLTGVHWWLYLATDWLGLVPIALCLGFGFLGLAQLICRRSLLRVDGDILVLGLYYLLVIGCYLVFETVPINCRPVLIDGRLEASYPSSTTLLVLSVMPTLAEQTGRRAKSPALRRFTRCFALGFSAFMVLGRLVSGVHWLTDILGAVLLSLGLFEMYRTAAERVLSWNWAKNSSSCERNGV